MKAKVFTVNGEVKGEINLPKIFEVAIREDIIKKALRSVTTRQAYGSFLRAGKQHSAAGKMKHRRRDYKTLYGVGQSRIPRKIMRRSGTRFTTVGAFMPGTVGGRRAHPPKTEKIWTRNINKKERTAALKSLIAATASLETLKERYPKVDFSKLSLPLIVEEKITELEKTKKLRELLNKILGNAKVLMKNKILLVSEKVPKVSHSIIESVKADDLNIQKLAPSGKPGRIVIYTEGAVSRLEKRK